MLSSTKYCKYAASRYQFIVTFLLIFLFDWEFAIETGLSDFHNMALTAFKSYFQKAEPKIFPTETSKTSPTINFGTFIHTQW